MPLWYLKPSDASINTKKANFTPNDIESQASRMQLETSIDWLGGVVSEGFSLSKSNYLYTSAN